MMRGGVLSSATCWCCCSSDDAESDVSSSSSGMLSVRDHAVVALVVSRRLDRDRRARVEQVAVPAFELRLEDRDLRSGNAGARPGIAAGRHAGAVVCEKGGDAISTGYQLMATRKSKKIDSRGHDGS